jgi:shikimate dehydrogenase
MHNAALGAAGLTGWRYQLLPVPPELLIQTIRALPAAGFAGANVTIPHKESALEISDQASP